MTAATESDLREIEALIGKLEWSVSYESPGHQDDARAALLAAVRKEIAATRAERDALAALVDEAISHEWTTPRDTAKFVSQFIRKAKALRAPQTGGANDGQT